MSMRNKIIYSFVFLLLHINISFSQDQNYNFQTKTIEISENGNLVKANFGKVISIDKNFEINANYFQYNKNTKLLKINGDGLIFIRSKDLKIEFDKGLVDQEKSIFEAYGKIKAKNLNINLNIDSQKIIYNFKDNILLSPFKTNLEYDYQKNLIANSFKYEIDKNLLKIKDLNLTDENKNNIKSSIAYINTKTNNLFGKNIFVSLNNQTFNKDNEPRFRGNSVKDNEKQTEVTKGVFTTCKKREGCPPWELSAKKIIHDKENKTINYENAIIKIYDKPVAYFPYFSHPDPTTKRKSGFLTPSLKSSSNRKNYLSLPYYLVLAENKDLTFSPRLYDHEEVLLQTEYRQVGNNSNHISDFSFKINDDKKLRSHFFYKFDKNFNLDNFLHSKLDLNIQTTTKDTYIKKNKIKSDIIKNENILENSAKINLSKDDMSINVDAFLYEDLNKNDSDRFEYILPKINLTKKIANRTSLNGDFSFKSKALARNYNTNIFETININDLVFKSYPKVTSKGFYNNYEFFIKNANINAKNSKTYKNKENAFVSGMLQFNSSIPLIKENEKYKKISKPRLSLKISPEYTKDNSDDDIKINMNNIYSINRAVRDNAIEGGLSLTYGNEFLVLDKKKSSQILNFKIANNLRLRENYDLPKNSQIGQKTSSIFNEISYSPNKYIKIDYNSSIKNNLTEMNYENITTEFRINNIVTSFDYLNQNESSNVSYFSNITKLNLDKSNSLLFSTRKNKIINLTEYYNLAYQYENDCLTASLEYNKEYYNDRDLKPNESIGVRLTIIPFKNKTNF